MKKLLAILLSVAMLLSACAMAEGFEIGLSNVRLYENGEAIINLSNMAVVLAFAAEDDCGAVDLHFDLNGNVLCDVLLALVGQQILMEVNTAEGLQGAYYLDLNTVRDMLGDYIDADMIQEAVTETLTGDESPVAGAAGILGEYLDGCVIDGGVTEIDGVAYETMLIDISPEQMYALIEAVMQLLAETGSITLDEVDEMLAILDEGDIRIDGSILSGDETSMATLTLYMEPHDVNDMSLTLGCYVQVNDIGNNSYMINVSLEATADDQNYGIDFDISALDTGDASWLPSGVGGAVDILAVDDIEAELEGTFAAFGNAIIFGAMQALLSSAA